MLESHAIINPPETAEQDVGGAWTRGDVAALHEAFVRHGTAWQAVAAELGRGHSPEECAVVLVSTSLRRSPLQRLVTLHAGRILRASRGDDTDTALRDRVASSSILAQASVVHRGIGLPAAAAAADAVMEHGVDERDRARRSVGGQAMLQSGGGCEGDKEVLKERACKGSMLAKLALRASVLARRETSDMRRAMVKAVGMQLEVIQSKTTQLLGNQMLRQSLASAP